jgi:Matrixin
MQPLRQLCFGFVAAAVLLSAAPTRAVTVKIDYNYDTNNFFGAGNPQGTVAGMQAKAAIESAAGFFTNILNDTLDRIEAPVYTSPRVTFKWHWTMGFNHPSLDSTATRTDEIIAADEFRIYAGARNHAGSTLAIGSPGQVVSWGREDMGNPNSEDTAQRTIIQNAFHTTLNTRGEISGFAAWGGSISFDADTPWHYNHPLPPTVGKTDLYSVALHELAHTLGFGSSEAWNSLVSGSNFTGAASMASNSGSPVPLGAGGGHWQEGTNSIVYGGATSQIALMGPSFPANTRRRLTALDAAGLTDIGWSVIPPPSLAGDYNQNGAVDAADYVLWRNTTAATARSATRTTPTGEPALAIRPAAAPPWVPLAPPVLPPSPSRPAARFWPCAACSY